MEITEVIRTILVIAAYILDVIIAVMLLGIGIALVSRIRYLPEHWMPATWDSSSLKDYKACWNSLSEAQKKQARNDRFIAVIGGISLLIIYLMGVFIAIHFFFPGVIEMARHI